MTKEQKTLEQLKKEMPLPPNYHGIGMDATKGNILPKAERLRQAQEQQGKKQPKVDRKHFEDTIDL